MGQLKIFKNANRQIESKTPRSFNFSSPYRSGENRVVNVAELAARLTGFWAATRWDMQNNPTGFFTKPENNYRYINFNCLNNSLNVELRYVCFEKFAGGKWSPKSGNFAAQIHRIIRFLNETNPSIQSLMDLTLPEWELRLRTFFTEKGEWRQRKITKLDKYQNQKQSLRGERCIEVFRRIYFHLDETYDTRVEFDRDVWDLSRAGISINPARGEHKLNFTRIKTGWLREAIKQHLRVFIATRSVTGSQKFIQAVACFDRFITKLYPNLTPEQINRQLLLHFISYLSTIGLTSNMQYSQIVTFRTFLEASAREQRFGAQDSRMIYEDDLPRRTKCQPRFIPEYVMSQLEKLIAQMPVTLRHLTLVLKETGVRISELCTLELNCMTKDGDGDYFLRYYQGKLRKEHSIPISKETASAIIAQIETVKDSGIKTNYLFPRAKGTVFKARYFNQILNKFAYDHKISDESGNLWRFQAHQFRHTLGTRLINGGVAQHIVQRFLGHESPEMTARYAQIHDQTLKNSFEEYLQKRGTLVDITGASTAFPNDETAADVNSTGVSCSPDTELLWLKKNIQAQALPNGYCQLPSVQTACPHANACLTCANFRTDRSFLPQHQAQLSETKKLVQISRNRGWERQEEMNKRIEINLEKIIESLTEENEAGEVDAVSCS